MSLLCFVFLTFFVVSNAIDYAVVANYLEIIRGYEDEISKKTTKAYLKIQSKPKDLDFQCYHYEKVLPLLRKVLLMCEKVLRRVGYDLEEPTYGAVMEALEAIDTGKLHEMEGSYVKYNYYEEALRLALTAWHMLHSIEVFKNDLQSDLIPTTEAPELDIDDILKDLNMGHDSEDKK
uniref:KIF-binding protein n=1 Tax=Clastoptera arizonana TaxID=38151 RepID=A0A1B6C8L3_9HEMI